MPLRLESRAADFAAAFQALVDDRRDDEADVSGTVARVIADVRARGDAAVRDYTRQFDRIDLDALGWAVAPAEMDAAVAACAPDVLAALRLAADRIRAFHERQRPQDHDSVDGTGIRAGWRWSAIEAVGLYVPGGLASYPSSVLMNALPAMVAGVHRLVMVTPTPDGRLNPLVLAAARLCGIETVFRIGGAQAVAALAYGTATIPAVDKIVGPGNAYVAEAKRQVFGRVGIDMIAGPSEILVIADGANDPHHIAADLLSQAEHDARAQAILITDSHKLAEAVAAAVEDQLAQLPASSPARASWERYGTLITVGDLAEAPALADRLAAEHVELCVADPHALFAQLRHAGSVFLGRHTPEAIGDYLGGPNHVLPTGRRARFSSGLGVLDFMKRTTFLEVPPAGLAAVGPSAVALADAEGLPAHALSVAVRLGQADG
jgi:histidinol dehydrogenase